MIQSGILLIEYFLRIVPHVSVHVSAGDTLRFCSDVPFFFSGAREFVSLVRKNLDARRTVVK